MRKLKFLLFTLAMIVGGVSSAWAQETPTNGNAYYIYNADNDLFFTRGAAYGTQAYASPFGIPWRVEITDGNYTLKMNDIYLQNNADTGLGYNGSFTDNNAPIVLTPSGNASDGYTLKNGDNYITCPASKGVVSMTTTASTWKFLTQAQYDAVLAARASSQETAVATSKGISIPGGSTLAAVVTDENAWSSTITNDGVPTKSTWPITGNVDRNGAYNEGTYGVEMFQTNDASITKTISGLAKGIYKVTVRGMKRMGTNEGNVALKSAGFYVSDAYMEANGNIIPMKSWASDNTANDVPNGPDAVVTIINNGGYTTEGFVYVGDVGTLTLTLHNDAFWWGGWCVFNGISYTFYNNEVSDDDATAILATATSLEAQEMDADLLSALSSAKTTFDGAHTIANYNALQTAIDAAQASADAYALFAPERTKALALGMTFEAIAVLAPDVHALMVAEYNFVNDNYSYGVSLGTWTTTNAIERHDQHWDGTTTSTYSEQNEGWWDESWNCSYSQDLTLPAGSYVFKVAGRKSSNYATITLEVKNGETSLGTVNDFPNGDTGLGINKNGATSFDSEDAAGFANSNNGRGWQWRYVKFTLADPATVTVSVNASASAKYQWVGFCNATVQTDNEANIALITYNIALNNAIAARDNALYKYVNGTERSELVAAIDADASLDKTDKSAIEAATTTLNTKRETFVNSAPSWNAYIIAKNTKHTDDLPYATDAKFAAIATAQSATAPTNATEADAKTAAINAAVRQYYESHALAEGVTGAEDKTSLITDPNFAGVTIDGTTAGGWTFDQTGGNVNIFSNESFTDGSGNSSYSYFDYNNDNNNNQNIHQTISNLAPGHYLLTATGRGHKNFNDNLQLYVNGKGDVKIPAVGNSGGIFNRGWNDASFEFYQIEAGDITIGAKTNNNKSGWWGVTRFRLVRLGDAVEEVKVTDAGFATYVPSYDLNFSSTIEAYKVKVSEQGIAKLTKVQEVPAGTPVLLYAEGGATENIPMITDATAFEDGTNDLVAGNATTATEGVATTDGDYTNMILNNIDNKIGFYFAAGQTVATNRAYLHILTTLAPATAGARMVMVFENEETGISTMHNAQSVMHNEVYNLNGQRVQNPAKGLYIVNGRKVVVK
jgi:hypothetical protein